MIIKTRITLRNEQYEEGHGFGRGVEQLLEGIQKYGSLNRAAKEIKMAYSKAWRILKEAEAEFGIQMVLRDGAHGSTLTKEGVDFLLNYKEMVAAADAAAQKAFSHFFVK